MPRVAATITAAAAARYGTRNIERQTGTAGRTGLEPALLWLRSSWAAIQATAAPSFGEASAYSNLRSIAISDWQCGQVDTWFWVLGSCRVPSITCSSTSMPGQSLVADTASCQI